MTKKAASVWMTIEREMFAPRNMRAVEYRSKEGNLFAKWDRDVQLASPPFKQAKHLIGRFGGIVPFSVAVGIYPPDIINTWLADKVPDKKRNVRLVGKMEYTLGLVPAERLPKMLAWARVLGIYLSGEDLWPDFVNRSYGQLEDMTRWLYQLKKSKRMTAFESRLIEQMMGDPE